MTQEQEQEPNKSSDNHHRYIQPKQISKINNEIMTKKLNQRTNTEGISTKHNKTNEYLQDNPEGVIKLNTLLKADKSLQKQHRKSF